MPENGEPGQIVPARKRAIFMSMGEGLFVVYIMFIIKSFGYDDEIIDISRVRLFAQ